MSVSATFGRGHQATGRRGRRVPWARAWQEGRRASSRCARKVYRARRGHDRCTGEHLLFIIIACYRTVVVTRRLPASCGCTSQRNSSRMSAADSTSFAPCRISWWQPRDRGEWIEAGNGKNLASRFRRQPRRDQRTAAQGRFDHQAAQPEAGDDAVAARESSDASAGVPNGKFADDHCSLFCNFTGQGFVACRIEAVGTGADYGDRARRRRQCAAMGGGIDAQREAADDGQRPASPQRPGQRPRRRASPWGVALRLPTTASIGRLSKEVSPLA